MVSKILIITLLFFNISLAQEITLKKFYLEIPSIENVPDVNVLEDQIKLNFNNDKLTELFNNYIVKSFQIAFPGAIKNELQIVYIIECEKGLIDEINSKRYGEFAKNEEIKEIEPLYIPNDYGINGGALLEQLDLDFIRADEAWDLTKGDNVTIGISEVVNESHEDLINKTSVGYGSPPSSTSVGHGTQVAIVAAANTDNSIGVSSIGFNAKIKYGSGYSALIPLANSGARVINMSWGSCNSYPLETQYGQLIMDQLWDSGIVLVAAAGNGGFSCSSLGPEAYHYPASLNNVISVTSVGHRADTNSTVDGNRKDVFENFNIPNNSWGVFKTTYNDKVDISAPGYDILTAANLIQNGYSYNAGTSFAAPIVTGLIGLMFDINSCLFPIEIESILKISSIKNDYLTLNSPYENKLGAGRIDAFEALVIAKEMSEPEGEIVINNKIFDRFEFVLKTTPYKILMNNDIFKEKSYVDFSAKNNILINDCDFYPNQFGSMNFEINPNYNLCNSYVSTETKKIIKNNESSHKEKSLIIPNPNDGNFYIDLKNDFKENEKQLKIEIFNINGHQVFYKNNLKPEELKFSLENISNGFYILRISNGRISEYVNFIKK